MEGLSHIFVAKTDMVSRSGSYLSLYAHLKDTAGIMAYLLRTWISQNLPTACKMSKEAFCTAAMFLAYVHDIGKATSAFQCRVIHGISSAQAAMHSCGLDASTIIEPAPSERAYAHHTSTGAAILTLLEAPPWAVSVVGAHHGMTIEAGSDFSDTIDAHRSVFYGKSANTQIWQETWKEILRDALAEAQCSTLADLPEDIPGQAQLLLSGLLIMADWIASNTKLFPLSPPQDIRYPDRCERAVSKLELPVKWQADGAWQFEDLCCLRFGFDASNPIQKALQEAAADTQTPGLFILEAPMGAGKTEAALTAGEILANRLRLSGLAFFLPSQATANSMFSRVCAWASQFGAQQAGWSEHWEKMSMELAHGKAFLNDEFTDLIGDSSDIDDEPTLTAHSFFLGNKTRLLADFVVGTVDQLLMGALRQKHIMLRHLGLAGKVVIIDEVHAYDAYMNTYLDCMLSWLGAYHVPVILLSATLPGQRRGELLRAYMNLKKPSADVDKIQQERRYPLLSCTDGENAMCQAIPLDASSHEVRISRGTDEDVVPFLQQQLQDGGCAGVIVNTVRRAQALSRLLRLTFTDFDIILDHAQFTMPDRIRREREIIARVGKASLGTKNRRLIVVGTQVLEQSLDIDFDVMVSDLCPMDLLLQRIGRMHRHSTRVRPASLQNAECLVLDAEAGSDYIYGEYLLTKTAALLKDSIRLPDDIPTLVQETYAVHSDAGELGELREEYEQQIHIRQSNAKQMCIKAAPSGKGRHASTRTIDGLINRQFDFSEMQQQAAVRDGAASIEVLVLQRGADNMLHPASDSGESFAVSANAMPSNEEAKLILRQSLRLPHLFSAAWRIASVIEELEQIRQTRLREWTQSKWIGRELFLILDENGCTTLAGVNIRYDRELGLCCEEGGQE